jgi:hypothetical protein
VGRVISVRVRPVVKRQTFTVGGLSPDLADLARQMLAAGIAPGAQIGDPVFEAQNFPPSVWKVQVKFFAGAIAITQVIA